MWVNTSSGESDKKKVTPNQSSTVNVMKVPWQVWEEIALDNVLHGTNVVFLAKHRAVPHN